MAESEDSVEICLDVFTDHYSTLTEALPVKSLIAKFVTAKIIKFSDQDEIMKGDTAEEKARLFLQHIAKPLGTRKCESLFKMINVVEKHGGQHAYLAKNIKKTWLNVASLFLIARIYQMELKLKVCWVFYGNFCIINATKL